MTVRAKPDAQSRSAVKVCRIVEALGTPDYAPKTLAAIAMSVRGSKTTVWRVLKQLEIQKWVRFDAASDTWRLAADFIRFAVAFQRFMDDRQRDLDAEWADMTGDRSTRK